MNDAKIMLFVGISGALLGFILKDMYIMILSCSALVCGYILVSFKLTMDKLEEIVELNKNDRR